jgi:phosphoribosylformimino-5-aminoimidazole carboxamide ribotide isomerase
MTDSFTIYPAIDLLDGKCVRLYQGDYAKSEQVAADPFETAQRFIDSGATHLHVIDLNGAKGEETVNLRLIEKLAKMPLTIQTGGGIRSLERIATLSDSGIAKFIIGSKAVQDKAFLEAAVCKYNERVLVGLDALNGTVRTDGWQKDSSLNFIDFAKTLEKIGVKTVIYTDISKDGTLQGTDIAGLKALKAATLLDVIASGGIKTLEDIKAARSAGASGAICGKSIYSGTLDLKEAIILAKQK